MNTCDCVSCGKKNLGSRVVSFESDGAEFKFFASGLYCDNCLIKEFSQLFKENLGTLIRLEDKSVAVNWSVYIKIQRSSLENESGDTSRLLLALGIFSLSAQGNWEIVADGPIGMNPRSNTCYVYFTRKKDAIAFAIALRLGEVLYPWEIRHISEVISKKEALAF